MYVIRGCCLGGGGGGGNTRGSWVCVAHRCASASSLWSRCFSSSHFSASYWALSSVKWTLRLWISSRMEASPVLSRRFDCVFLFGPFEVRYCRPWRSCQRRFPLIRSWQCPRVVAHSCNLCDCLFLHCRGQSLQPSVMAG
jgi:hypothetical protein